MTKEFKNYLRRLVNPFFTFQAGFYFVNAIFKKVIRIFVTKEKISITNDDIQKIRSEILTSGDYFLKINEPIFEKKYVIRLAIGQMEIQTSKDWHHRFQDAEINVSIDRWGWLITGISDEHLPLNPEDGILLIRSWCSQFINNEEFAKDAYSTGERISNLVLFFTLHNVIVPDDILLILNKFSYQVAKHIEYEPFNLTGNHAFNNARSLYLASSCNFSSTLDKLAISIFRERLPVLVSNNGFMREGSSHYHFLFTRWVLEIIWFARRNDHKEILELLTPYANKLLKQCWFFLIQNKEDFSWSFPLIGDVSPDCPPKWLIALPWSFIATSIYKHYLPIAPENLGWTELFGGIEKCNLYEIQEKNNFSYKCGWHRIENFGWTIIIYSPDKDGHIKATHEHQDIGSFVAYYNGKPIIIDTGRLDYTNSPTSRYGKSANSHNTITIDEIEAEPDIKAWMLPSYARISSFLSIKVTSNKVNILLSHNGFKRIAYDNISHERSIIITPNSLEVIDNIEGAGVHSVCQFFHFMTDFSFTKLSSNIWQDIQKKIIFKANINSDTILYTGKDSSDYGWMYPAYGKKKAASTFKIDNLVALPVQMRNMITIESF